MARNEVEQARGPRNVPPPKTPNKAAHLVDGQGLVHRDRDVDANGPPFIRRPSEPMIEDLRPQLSPKLKKGVLFLRFRHPSTEDRTAPTQASHQAICLRKHLPPPNRNRRKRRIRTQGLAAPSAMLATCVVGRFPDYAFNLRSVWVKASQQYLFRRSVEQRFIPFTLRILGSAVIREGVGTTGVQPANRTQPSRFRHKVEVDGVTGGLRNLTWSRWQKQNDIRQFRLHPSLEQGAPTEFGPRSGLRFLVCDCRDIATGEPCGSPQRLRERGSQSAGSLWRHLAAQIMLAGGSADTEIYRNRGDRHAEAPLSFRAWLRPRKPIKLPSSARPP